MKSLRLATLALAGFALAGTAFVQSASAECYWTGYDWACRTAPAYSGYYQNRYAASRNYPHTGFPTSGTPGYPGPRPGWTPRGQ